MSILVSEHSGGLGCARWLTRAVAGVKARLVALSDDKSGVAAIEFALVGPMFLMIVFATLEVPIIGWNHEGLSRAAIEVRDYMEDQRNAREPIDHTVMRAKLCEALTTTTMSCAPDKLIMGVYNTSDYANKTIVSPAVPEVITREVVSFAKYPADSYVIVLAYNWDSVFPTSKLLLPHNSKTVQIQARTLVLLSQRPYDNLGK